DPMTNKTVTTSTRRRNTQTSAPVAAETLYHVEQATEAVLEGWSREQVIDTLISRIRRDRRYLAYRKACNRRTSYADQVQHDMRALALAAVWLDAGGVSEQFGPGQLPLLRRGQECIRTEHFDQGDQHVTQQHEGCAEQPHLQVQHTSEGGWNLLSP